MRSGTAVGCAHVELSRIHAGTVATAENQEKQVSKGSRHRWGWEAMNEVAPKTCLNTPLIKLVYTIIWAWWWLEFTDTIIISD